MRSHRHDDDNRIRMIPRPPVKDERCPGVQCAICGTKRRLVAVEYKGQEAPMALCKRHLNEVSKDRAVHSGGTEVVRDGVVRLVDHGARICRECQKNPTEEGKYLCPECVERHQNYNRAVQRGRV